MSQYKLQIQLLSDTTFGRGDGVAGVIDQEVEHDSYGFPYLRGRTLKGLISEECDNLIARLSHNRSYWEQIAGDLFGRPGSTLDTIAAVHFGDACLPNDLRQAVAYQIKNNRFTRAEILDSLTTIRRQTAIHTETGVPDQGSLRSARVALRDLCFTADLSFIDSPSNLEDLLSLLIIGAKALRYIGSGRNRGRGHVYCTLTDDQGKPIPQSYFDRFFTPLEA